MTPEQTDVERVARAICKRHMRSFSGDGHPFDSLSNRARKGYFSSAGAAICAMQPIFAYALDARADEIQRDHLPVSAVNELRDAAKSIRAIGMGVK